MKRLIANILEIERECENVAVMFSCGRDSICMLDLFMKHARSSVGSVIFMYYCPGLSYEEKILRYYENRYKITIHRIAHPDIAAMVNSRVPKGRRLRVADAEKLIRADFEALWTAWGYRKDESLQRRGQLTLTEYGIDWKYRKVFPLAEWTAPHIRRYAISGKLLLPVEYQNNMRDLNTFKGDSLLYIHNNYPEDYERIVAMYPDTAGELMRAQSGHGGK